MRGRIARRVGAAACMALVAGGCTASRPGATAGAEDAAGRCAAAALGGAVLGTLIGAAAAGNRGAGAGALIGGAAGGVGCAVLAALDAQDRARIRQAQIAAVAANQPRVLAYQGADGRRRAISIRPKPAPAPAGDRLCRTPETDVTLDGTGRADLPAPLICRTPAGDWLPA